MYKSPLWQIAIALAVLFAAYEIVVMFLQALLILPAGERGARVVKAEPSDGRACAMRSRATEPARRTNPEGTPIEVFDGIRAGVLADRSQSSRTCRNRSSATT